MLAHLSISNYAIVEHLDLELEPGTSVITGETGAGKSIMLDALGLALGDRADSAVVRTGSDRADILASFDISRIPEARQWLQEHELEDGDSCILRRVITREGRSRAYVNGTPCPLAGLKSLGERLIDIHSQHEHQSLLKSETHRRLLDEFSHSQELAREVQHIAQQWKQQAQRLERLSNTSREQLAHQQLLGYQLEELDNLALQPGEVEHLEQEHKTLSQAGQILGNCRQVIELCSENDAGNVLSALRASLHKLGSSQSLPDSLEEASSLLSSAQIQVEEAVTSLNRFIDHFEADPARQLEIEQRLDLIYQLARKHRLQPQELPQMREHLQQELDNLQHDEQSLERIQQELDNLQDRYHELAGRLSQQRLVAAESLAKAVETKMQSLGMPGGRFEIRLLPSTDGSTLHPNGLEQIEFVVSANPGQPLRALARVASGGELSRISLAIQVITAQTSRIPTLVFDEVDVGIGGPTAEIVGQLLRELGEKGQVLTVTHLPQVAAQSHHHLFVHKLRGDAFTHTSVRKLGKKERIEEIARMLGGVELTRESLAHARSLFQPARSAA